MTLGNVLSRRQWLTIVSQALVLLLGVAVFRVVGLVAAAITVITGLVAILFVVHTHWMYGKMRDDPSFNHSPKIAAPIGVGIVWAIPTVIITVLLAVVFLFLSGVLL